jgi:hypothetical protein
MTQPPPRPFLHLVKSLAEPAVARINITELYSVREWSNRYGCTPEALRAAVAAVGNVATDVERHLRPGREAVHDLATLRAAFSDQPSAADDEPRQPADVDAGPRA